MLLRSYLLRAVLSRAALATAMLALIVLGFDLGDQGRRLAAVLGWGTVLKAAWLHLPLMVVQVCPAGLLLGAVLALVRLRQQGELAALAVSGAGGAVVRTPLLLAGALWALLALGLDEALVPWCEQQADRLYQHRRVSPLTGLGPSASWSRHGPWMVQHLRRQGAGQTVALELDTSFRVLRRVELTGDGEQPRVWDLARISHHLLLRRAIAAHRHGLLPALSSTHRKCACGELRSEVREDAGSHPPRDGVGEKCGLAHGSPRPRPLPRQRLPGLSLAALQPPRANFRPEALSAMELHRQLNRREALGQARVAEHLVLQTKLAYPLLNLVVALVACAFAGPWRRRAAVWDLLAALGLLLLLWLLLAGGWLVSRGGWLSPAVAVWGGVGLGLVLALALLRRRP